MTKPVAIGPYQALMPFVNIQQIQIGPLGVRLIISNEVLEDSALARQETIKVGNYILTSNSKATIEQSYVDNATLRNRIIREQNNTVQLTLRPPKDLKPKADLKRDSQQTILQHVYSKQRLLTEEAMSGDLYVLVASFVYTPSTGAVVIGNVLKETILINGRPPIQGNIYSISNSMANYGSTGEMWVSSTHSHRTRTSNLTNNAESTSMVGRTHILAPHPSLTEEAITNLKTTDLRILQETQRALPQVGTSNNRPVQQNNGRDINLPTRSEERPAAPDRKATGKYFSQVHLTRDDEGVIYGYFGFDLIDYFKHNSLFGRYIDNPVSLASCVEVLDIRIKRLKTKKIDLRTNALTAGAPHSRFCKLNRSGAEYPYEIVASLGAGAEIIKKFNDGEILGIAFRDAEAMTYYTGGLQYIVEVMIRDNTKQAFIAAREDITAKISNWDKWSIRAPSPEQMIEGDNLAGDVVASYMASIEFFKGNDGFGRYSPTEWQKTLRTLTSKMYAHEPPSDDQVIHAIIGGYVAYLDSIINTNNQSTKSNVADFNSSISQKDSPLGLVARANLVIAGGFKMGNPGGVGLDYIDEYLSTTEAVIPSISYTIMEQRVEQEENKFSDATLSAIPTNRYGYLTPTSVRLGPDNLINTESQQIDLRGQAALMVANPPTTLPMPDLTPSTTQNANAAVLSALGVSISRLPVSLNRLVAASELVTPQTTPSFNMLGGESQFNQDDLTAQSANSGSAESIINTGRLQAGAFSAYAGPLAEQVVREEFESFSLPSPPTSNPAPASLATATTGYAEGTIDTDPLPAALNFGCQVRVEFLSGYSVEAGIGAENWKTLTALDFNNARDNAELLVCRLVQVHDPVFSPSGKNRLFTPLSTVFVMGPLRGLQVQGEFTPLYRSYLASRLAYNEEFSSVQRIYGIKALYSQVVPLDEEIARAAAEVPSRPPLTLPSISANQTIPRIPISPPKQERTPRVAVVPRTGPRRGEAVASVASTTPPQPPRLTAESLNRPAPVVASPQNNPAPTTQISLPSNLGRGGRGRY